MKPLRSPGELAPELADLLDQLANNLAVLRDDWREEIDAARPHLDPDGEWIVPYVDLWRGESSGLRTDAAAWLEAWTRLAKRPAKAKQTIERMAGIDALDADTFARAEAIAVELQTSLDVSGDVTVKPIHLDDGVWAVRRVRAAFRLWANWITTHPLERSPIESGSIVGQLAQSAEDWKRHAEAFAAADKRREELANRIRAFTDRPDVRQAFRDSIADTGLNPDDDLYSQIAEEATRAGVPYTDVMNGTLADLAPFIIGAKKRREDLSESHRGESIDDLRPSSWFSDATDEGLYPNLLRIAMKDGRLKSSTKRGGILYHSIREVVKIWPQYRIQIVNRLKDEAKQSDEKPRKTAQN